MDYIGSRAAQLTAQRAAQLTDQRAAQRTATYLRLYDTTGHKRAKQVLPYLVPNHGPICACNGLS